MSEKSGETYTIPVRVLRGKSGRTLLVESAEQVKARYADVRTRLEIQLTDDEAALAIGRKQIDAAESQEAQMMGRVEKERGADIRTYVFTFRRATIDDNDRAERAAARGALVPATVKGADPTADPFLRDLLFRQELAALTFESTDHPDCQGKDGKGKPFGEFDAALGGYLMREVAAGAALSKDWADFLSP